MEASISRVVAVGTLVILLVVSLWLLCWYAVDLLLLVFAGLLFGVFLQSLSEQLAEWTALTYAQSLAIVVVSVAAVAAVAGFLLFDLIAGEFEQLATELPRAFAQLTATLESSSWGRWLVARLPSLQDVEWETIIWRNGGVLPKTLGTTLAALSGIVVVMFIGIYFAAQPNVYRRGLLRLIAISKRQRVDEVLREVGTTLHWWLAGQILAMTCIAVFTVIGLRILGIDLALALGVLAGVLAFIPYIGPILAFVPAALIALLRDPSMILWVGLLYLGIQTVESYLLTPNIHRKAVSLPPILTLVAQLVLGSLAGTLGLLLATPLMASAIPSFECFTSKTCSRTERRPGKSQLR